MGSFLFSSFCKNFCPVKKSKISCKKLRHFHAEAILFSFLFFREKSRVSTAVAFPASETASAAKEVASTKPTATTAPTAAVVPGHE
jgi:hypothetical protein